MLRFATQIQVFPQGISADSGHRDDCHSASLEVGPIMCYPITTNISIIFNATRIICKIRYGKARESLKTDNSFLQLLVFMQLEEFAVQ